MTLSEQMIAVGKQYLDANHQTSYVKGMIDDSLSEEQKDYYNIQDISFEYNEISVIAALQQYANSAAEATVFTKRMDLQVTMLNDWLAHNVHPAPTTWQELAHVDIEPINELYQQHMAATIVSGKVLQILPSFYAGEWIYVKLGQQLQISGLPIAKPNSDFLGEHGYLNEYAHFVDQEATHATDSECRQALATFTKSAVLECYFWNAAYQQDSWEKWRERAIKAHY